LFSKPPAWSSIHGDLDFFFVTKKMYGKPPNNTKWIKFGEWEQIAKYFAIAMRSQTKNSISKIQYQFESEEKKNYIINSQIFDSIQKTYDLWRLFLIINSKVYNYVVNTYGKIFANITRFFTDNIQTLDYLHFGFGFIQKFMFRAWLFSPLINSVTTNSPFEYVLDKIYPVDRMNMTLYYNEMIIKKLPSYYNDIQDEYKLNPRILYALLKYNPNYFRYTPESVRDNDYWVDLAYDGSSSIIQYASRNQQIRKGFDVEDKFFNGSILKDVNVDLRNIITKDISSNDLDNRLKSLELLKKKLLKKRKERDNDMIEQTKKKIINENKEVIKINNSEIIEINNENDDKQEDIIEDGLDKALKVVNEKPPTSLAELIERRNRQQELENIKKNTIEKTKLLNDQEDDKIIEKNNETIQLLKETSNQRSGTSKITQQPTVPGNVNVLIPRKKKKTPLEIVDKILEDSKNQTIEISQENTNELKDTLNDAKEQIIDLVEESNEIDENEKEIITEKVDEIIENTNKTLENTNNFEKLKYKTLSTILKDFIKPTISYNEVMKYLSNAKQILKDIKKKYKYKDIDIDKWFEYHLNMTMDPTGENRKYIRSMISYLIGLYNTTIYRMEKTKKPEEEILPLKKTLTEIYTKTYVFNEGYEYIKNMRKQNLKTVDDVNELKITIKELINIYVYIENKTKDQENENVLKILDELRLNK